MLSHYNFVSEGMQVAAWVEMSERDTVLAVLPIFHGFGLGALVHAGLASGAKLVLVPQFTPEIVAKLLKTKRPTLMAGVPTLYEALARDPSLQRTDLSSLRAAFCGADTLTRPVKERFEQLVRDRGGNVRLLEGYGLTEAVTAVMGTPLDHYREGSVGVPFLWGVALANFVHGVPLDSNGDYSGSFWDLFSAYTVFAGIVVVALFAFHGCMCTRTAACGCTPATSAVVTTTASSTSRPGSSE